MKYRPEIDGLRAVAVVPVVLFHAGLAGFDGGYLGVDVFFVISGYLITTIILDDIAMKRFSIMTFYERRFRRILPAYVVVVLASMVPALLWMMPVELRDFGQSIFASSVFASNFFFLRETGYFATGTELRPLLHTWSLSVEEQFYVFFPLMLAGLAHLRWRWTALTIALITAFSLGLSELGWRHWPSANFYLLPFRAWELGIGALASILIRLYAPRQNAVLSGAGFLLLAASLALFDETTPMPSIYGLAPVLGTALIIVFAAPSTWAGRLLSLKPVVFIGLISYSTYLWHQPLLAFARIRSIPSASEVTIAAAVLASFGLGYLSWRYVERPFRKGGALFTIPRARLLGGSVTALAGLTIVGLGLHVSRGLPERIPERAAALAAVAQERSPHVSKDKCLAFTTLKPVEHPLAGCDTFLSEGKADVVFIGDSHAGTVTYTTQLALAEKGISSYGYSYAGCIGLRGFERFGMEAGFDCLGYNEKMIDYAREVDAKVIVVVSRFPLYLTGKHFDNGEGGVEPGEKVVFDRAGSGPGSGDLKDPARVERMLSGFTEELQRLTDEFEVVLVEPIPEAGWAVPLLAAKTAYFGDEDRFTISTNQEAYRTRAEAILQAFDAVEGDRLFRVHPEDVFCGRPEPGRCINATQDEVYYFDNNHLSRAGTRQLLPSLVAAIEAALGPRNGEHPIATGEANGG